MSDNQLGSFDLEWECCKDCKHYYEKGIHNGCLKISTIDELAFPDEDDMTMCLDGNYVIVECDLFEDKGDI